MVVGKEVSEALGAQRGICLGKGLEEVRNCREYAGFRTNILRSRAGVWEVELFQVGIL